MAKLQFLTCIASALHDTVLYFPCFVPVAFGSADSAFGSGSRDDGSLLPDFASDGQAASQKIKR